MFKLIKKLDSLPRGLRDEPPSAARPVRILDFMETSWVGGPAKNLLEFAQRIAYPQNALRVTIAMATFRRGSLLASDEFTAACERAGVSVNLIRERFAFDPNVIWAMRRLITAYQPDIIQTHSVKSHFLMRLSGMHRQFRWIAFHHGYTWTSLKARSYNCLDRWSLPLATRVVTVCRPFATTLLNIGVSPDRIVIRHNAVRAFVPMPSDRVVQLRRTLGIEPDTQVLLTVGRLSNEKGHRDLIEAIALLRRHSAKRRLRLIIVGDGPAGPGLRNATKKLALEDCIFFAGHQPDVTPYYSLADLMLLPSHTEGSPNSLLEGLAAGLPVVATAVGGIPEIVNPKKAAVLVEKENPFALMVAIARVLDNETLRSQLSAAARSTAVDYSPESYCNAMLSLYRSCLAEEQQNKGRPLRLRSSPPSDSAQVFVD